MGFNACLQCVLLLLNDAATFAAVATTAARQKYEEVDPEAVSVFFNLVFKV